MKILILSDTHGSLPEVKTIVERESRETPIDLYLHAGDVLYHGPRNPLPGGYTPADLATFLSQLPDIRYVRGNCDSDVDQMVLEAETMPRTAWIQFGNVKIHMNHGDRMHEDERIQVAKSEQAHLTISGHTHRSVLKRQDSVIVLNPGSTTLPKDGTASYAVLDGGWIQLKAVQDGRILASIELFPD